MPKVIREIVQQTKADLFFGSYLKDIGNSYSQNFNSAFFAKRMVSPVYNKNRLIPFGESLPFTKSINRAIYQVIPGISFFLNQTKHKCLVPRQRKEMNTTLLTICYEALAPELLRSHINSLKKCQTSWQLNQ